jgi:chromosome segregation ATPase
MIRIIEGVQSYLGFLKDHLADCAAAAVETSHAVAQMAETLPAITRHLAEMAASLESIDARLNRYIDDQAQQEGKVGRLSAQVSEIREKLKAANG